VPRTLWDPRDPLAWVSSPERHRDAEEGVVVDVEEPLRLRLRLRLRLGLGDLVTAGFVPGVI
jgi:hypothetical protein